jgi:hypothetical protein
MRSTLRAGGVLALVSLVLGTVLAQGVQRGAGLPTPLPLFPPDNWWNADVSAASVDTNSASYISFIGTAGHSIPTSAAHPLGPLASRQHQEIRRSQGAPGEDLAGL